jgi:hypothetical protein
MENELFGQYASPFKMEFFTGFSWAVPTAFSDALAKCYFEEGDILYDTRLAYQQWDEATKNIKHIIQVKKRLQAAGQMEEESSGNTEFRETVFVKNWSSQIQIEHTDYGKQQRTEIITTTHGRLYTLLWHGDLLILSQDVPSPRIPVRISQVVKKIDEISYRIADSDKGNPIFVMPCDLTNQLYRNKRDKVRSKLLSRYKVDIRELTPKDSQLSDWEMICPTILIYCFAIHTNDIEDIKAAIKDALYLKKGNVKPQNEAFRLRAHGKLIEP